MTNNFNKVETALTVSCPITWILLKITKYYINYRVDHKKHPKLCNDVERLNNRIQKKEVA